MRRRALERLLRVASEESTETSSTSQQSGLLVQPLRKLQAALTKSRCLREAALMTLGRLGR